MHPPWPDYFYIRWILFPGAYVILPVVPLKTHLTFLIPWDPGKSDLDFRHSNVPRLTCVTSTHLTTAR